MKRSFCCVLLNIVLCLSNVEESYQSTGVATGELENHNPELLELFMNINDTIDLTKLTEPGYASSLENTTSLPVPDKVNCYGLSPTIKRITSIFFNMKPDSSSVVNTHFYFSSRKTTRVQVFRGTPLRVDFKRSRKTVMIVHGFRSHSNASWVNNMTRAFLAWEDVNVIAVDWSGGARTWKYWRAVANVRRVGYDTVSFMRQLMKATNVSTKDMHFVGHSLGAHVASYVSYELGKVARITALDPAQPCFNGANSDVRLEASDADFVDVIHTNGRYILWLGLGLPEPIGHADFYPNGGMKQPGCMGNNFYPLESTFKLPEQAICSHGRAYKLFTESLINNNCSFRGYKWDLTYEGVNASLKAAYKGVRYSEMGIRSIGIGGVTRASGNYFVLTTDKEPYCPTESERRHPDPELLNDLRHGFQIDQPMKMVKSLSKKNCTTTPKKYWLGRIPQFG